MALLREVSDVVRILHELMTQLDRLSTSELETLNHNLAHTQDHVVQEINSRGKRRNRAFQE